MPEEGLQKSAIFILISAGIALGISYQSIYLLHIAIVLYAFHVLYLSIQAKSFPFKVKLDFDMHTTPLWIIIGWYVISLLWAENTLLSLKYLVYIAIGVTILHSTQIAGKGLPNQYKMLQVLGAVIGIEMLISILEGFTGFRYPISPYSELAPVFGREIGYDKNLPQNVIQAIQQIPTGFHWNPNNLAVTMMLSIPFFIFHKKWLLKIIGVLAALTIIFLTGSRGAYISLGIMFGIMFIFYLSNKTRLALIAALIVSIGAVYLNKNSLEKKYAHQYNDLCHTTEALYKYMLTDHALVNDTSSISIRQQLTKNGYESLAQTKGLGVGAGNSVHMLMKKDNTHKIYSMHNFWIEILTDGGILVFSIWITWYIYLIISLIRLFKKSTNEKITYFAKSSSLALIALAGGIISISSSIYFLPMWILLGFSILTLKNAETINTRSIE